MNEWRTIALTTSLLVAPLGLAPTGAATAGGWGYGDCCVPYAGWCCAWRPHLSDLPRPYPEFTPYRHSYVLYRGRIYRFAHYRPYRARPRRPW